MGVLSQLEQWSSRHNPRWLVVVRAGLGLCLFIKGIQFIRNSIYLDNVFAGSLPQLAWMAEVLPYIHLLGGALIIAGLFTRFWCALHIPVLLGAIFMVNIKQGFFSGGTDLPFSIILLLLLIFFLIEGSGRLSLDNAFRKQQLHFT
ncbi:MAG TPA: DoxX family protein [Ferruginibacter sp.]|nr:DoxX family protein [Ferruginibacter sp.]HMP21576.1 DoxX family protein [Ferruginibacter sp.]